MLILVSYETLFYFRAGHCHYAPPQKICYTGRFSVFRYKNGYRSHRFNTFLRKRSSRTYTRKTETHNLKHSININTWMEAQRVRNEVILPR